MVGTARAGQEALPALRQDLGLYPAPPQPDGSPAWHLHDPAANRFYLIGWPAFEILSRWSCGDAAAILASIAAETTLELDMEEIQAVATFLERHHLLDCTSGRDTARLRAALAARRMHWARWLLRNYLFFRIPLIRPGAWLDRIGARIGAAMAPAFWLAVGVLATAAVVLVARQWEQFVHTFAGYRGWEAVLAFGLAVSAAKVAHELGHAATARHYGCRVPAMGVAFLVMWPVLYTDTNEAWKLRSRRARLAIGAAGMATELVLAVLATWLWLLLPDGPPRAAAFLLATSTWLMTLAINASPFMRFDGYFLLSDLLGIANLHDRAFAQARWWLREALFRLDEPPPEDFAPRRRRGLIAFAFATWLYRFALFLSIALLVYHAFFKALGLVLMLVEIGWFIVRPLVQEAEAWWQRRHGMAWNRATRRTAAALALLFAALILPWQTDVAAPAMLVPGREQTLYAPMAAQVVEEPARALRDVGKGDVLLRLASPDLDHRLALARIEAAGRRWKVEQQSFSETLQAQGETLRRRWEEAEQQVAGLVAEQERLTLRAPFDGAILMRSDELAPGTWVSANEALYAVADRRDAQIEALVGEADRDRLGRDAVARFLPDTPEFGRYDCRVAEMDSLNLAQIDELALASPYGGPVPTRPDAHGRLVPTEGVYRVRLDRCDPTLAPARRLRGTAHIDAAGRSPLSAALRQVLRTLAREGGL